MAVLALAAGVFPQLSANGVTALVPGLPVGLAAGLLALSLAVTALVMAASLKHETNGRRWTTVAALVMAAGAAMLGGMWLMLDMWLLLAALAD